MAPRENSVKGVLGTRASTRFILRVTTGHGKPAFKAGSLLLLPIEEGRGVFRCLGWHSRLL